ncbi:MAG: hypothetical protein R3244_06815, partial [Thermoanaerobaculia bacterium]|nr:hypothetical protein [Thermoanaerobaculia bacterium]
VEEEVAALRRAVSEMEARYRAEIERLEERIAALESDRPSPAGASAGEPGASDEAARLRAAARAAAAPTEAVPPPDVAGGRQRNLNRLNPEISATGIFAGIASDLEREEFERGEFELDLQATLDPFSSMRWTIAFTEEGEVEIEEGYLTYSALPGGLSLTAGRFRQRFGALNRQHVHALPQTSYPLALARVFGEEGLGQTGIGASWLLPRPWASANEIVVEITDGENEFFGGESFDDFALLARLKNFWEVSSSTYVEWGLSGMDGRTESGEEARLWGSDLTLHWRPPQRAKYREITWRTEALLAERAEADGLLREAWGGYSYLEGLVARNLYVGVRYDWSEDPLDPTSEAWAVVPYVTWWQSEWVRLRGEFERRQDDALGETENRFTLQLTWAAGPHKHETY